jgi:integrase
MGTIVKRDGKRGPTYRAVIRRVGRKPLTKTFKRKTPASAWLVKQEAKIDERRVVADGHTVGSILLDAARAAKERSDGAKTGDKTAYKSKSHHHYERLGRQLIDVELGGLSAKWWVDTVKTWKCSAVSRVKYLGYITGALKRAEQLHELELDWSGYHKGYIVLKADKLIAKSKPRFRRITSEEIAAIKKHVSSSLPMSDLIDFALELGMRAAEITRLAWADLDRKKKMLWVRNRKHKERKIGNDWRVPLLGTSYDIIARQPTEQGGDGRIFPYNEESVEAAFRRARKAAGIIGRTYHDLRHEALSRLFKEGYQIQEVSMVSGHEDWASLKIYTNLNPEDLHAGPSAKRAMRAS